MPSSFKAISTFNLP